MWKGENVQVSLGCEAGNNDGGVTGEVLPLWYSLKEVVKVPEAGRRGNESRNVEGRGEFYHFLPLAHWRQTGRGKVSRWETLSAPQSFFLKTWRPFTHPNHSHVCGWRSCMLKAYNGLLPVFQIFQQESCKTRSVPSCHCWTVNGTQCDLSPTPYPNLTWNKLELPVPERKTQIWGCFGLFSSFLSTSCVTLKPH